MNFHFYGAGSRKEFCNNAYGVQLCGLVKVGPSPCATRKAETTQTRRPLWWEISPCCGKKALRRNEMWRDILQSEKLKRKKATTIILKIQFLSRRKREKNQHSLCGSSNTFVWPAKVNNSQLGALTSLDWPPKIVQLYIPLSDSPSPSKSIVICKFF